MSQTRARRGRPKGSGIDDRQRLDAVARLIASNPALKPTTAIRSLGVSDPSVIRRLRDKFNVVRGELMEELGSSTAGASRKAAGAERQTRPDVPPPSVRSIDGEPSRQQRARSIAANSATAARNSKSIRSEPVATAGMPQQRAAQAQPAAPRQPSKHPGDGGDADSERLRAGQPPDTRSQDLCMSLMSAGFAMANTMLSAQSAFTREFVRSPYLSLMLRQQLAFSQWTMGLVTASRIASKTVR